MSLNSEVGSDLSLNIMDLPENLEPDNPLWHFALAFWQHLPAQQACLALQNEGWSVTRILCAGWLALNGRAYARIEDATVTEWRDRVTGSLRAIRMSMPKEQPAYNALRSNIASLELEAERIELALAWQTLTESNSEQSTMDERDHLIRLNLAAAAPASATTADTRQPLCALGDFLITLQQGYLQP